MARKPPGALRATARRRPGPSRPEQIDGLSARTCSLIKQIEDTRSRAGSVARALALYERFLRGPAGTLYLPRDDCPCCDVLSARDDLELALAALPPGTGRDLRRRIARLDAEFERRTLHDPHRARLHANIRRAWWHYRVLERT